MEIGKKILANIIDEEVNRVMLEEGWFKNAAMGAAIGLSSLMPGTSYGQSNSGYQNNNDTVKSVGMNVQYMSLEQLQKLFPQAYKDRNANPQVWEKNQKLYTATLSNGKISLVGKIAASHGQNPWEALVNKYCQNEHDSVFELSDFDI